MTANVALLCDTARTGQLLSNLLKNALLHGSSTEAVQVRCKHVNGIFELPVTNGGTAIDPDVASQLIKPFCRAQVKNPRESLGHGGTMDVVSSGAATSFIYKVKTGSFVERRSIVRS